MSNPFANWTPEMVAAHNKRLSKLESALTRIETSIEDERSEKELQAMCANYLRQRGIPFATAIFGRKSTTTAGWPDFSFPYQGRFYGVEFKVGSNHPTPEQTRCLQAIESNGGIAVVIRDFESFVRLLK